MKVRNLFAALVISVVMSSVQAFAFSGNPTDAVFVVVGGTGQSPKTIYVSDLLKLPQAQENVTYFAAGAVVTQSFTGVLLWDLLQSVGIPVNSSIKNDILHKTVVVTGTDGYESVFGVGEIDPNFGGNQIMVAYLANGVPLDPSQGPTRIVVPSDKEGGRFVSLIATITIKDGG